MATLRKFLIASEFDWGTGKILIQEGDGWGLKTIYSRYITFDDPILDRTFHDGYGSPECPRYVAEDAVALYFPYQYDGLTGPVKIYKDLNKYLNELTPYPGG